jgi:DNA topoisomerase VI subunit B
MSNTKITVKVWEQQLAVFDKAIDELFIKRDAFLNHMIKVETPHLAADLKDRRLSMSGNRYIAGELKRLGTKPVNIVVEKATADALNEVVSKANIVRDAFVNRLIMLLRAPDALLKFWELPLNVRSSDAVDSPATSPLNAIKGVYYDPLYYLRDAAETRHEVGLYTAWLPPKLVGLECFIEDDRVPGTEQHKKKEKEHQELIDALASVEAAAFQSQGLQAGGKK